MFIYNVTIKVMHSVVDQWIEWMRAEHMDDMLATGQFTSYKLHKLLEHDDEEGVTFVVQYYCNEKSDYENYIDKYSEQLRNKGYAKFGDKYIAFRTVMEVIV